MFTRASLKDVFLSFCTSFLKKNVPVVDLEFVNFYRYVEIFYRILISSRPPQPIL